jgi:biotin operon repressor
MAKKYVVRLTDSERASLSHLIKKQRAAAQRVLRAQVLLKTDSDGPMWTHAKIAEAFGCSRQTIEKIRERFVAEGFDVTIDGKPKRRVRGKILDAEQEAKIIAMRLGSPPKGFANWILRLLAEQAVALEIAECVSDETVRRTLKKTERQTAR